MPARRTTKRRYEMQQLYYKLNWYVNLASGETVPGERVPQEPFPQRPEGGEIRVYFAVLHTTHHKKSTAPMRVELKTIVPPLQGSGIGLGSINPGRWPRLRYFAPLGLNCPPAPRVDRLNHRCANRKAAARVADIPLDTCATRGGNRQARTESSEKLPPPQPILLPWA